MEFVLASMDDIQLESKRATQHHCNVYSEVFTHMITTLAILQTCQTLHILPSAWCHTVLARSSFFSRQTVELRIAKL